MSERDAHPKAHQSVSPREIRALEESVQGMDEPTRRSFIHNLPKIADDWKLNSHVVANPHGAPPPQMSASIPAKAPPVDIPPTD